MTPQSQRRRASAVAFLVFVLLATGLGTTWWAMERQWQSSTSQELDQTATQAALRLQDYVRSRLRAVQALGQTSALDTELSPEEFAARSLVLQENFGGFQALNWIALDGTIEIVVPLDANRGALGKSVLDHPIASSAFDAARKSATSELTRPLDLFQGGRGVAAYVPVVRGKGVIGYLNAVFRIRALVEDSLGAGMLDSHTLRIVDEDTPLYESEGHASATARPFGEASAEILGRTWVLRTHPDSVRWKAILSNRPRWVFVAALVLALIASLLLRSTLLRRWHQVQVEHERLSLQIELERSARMRSLGRLAGGVAHDFNNILTAIVGTAELMALTTDSRDVREGAQEIVTSAERAGDLTGQLLMFSNSKQPEPSLVDVNAQVEDMRKMLSRLVSEDIAISIELGADVPTLLCSSGQLSQIIVNLVVNAADAMPDGGEIAIETRAETKEGAEEGAEAQPGVLISVADTGTGMDEATQRRIFEPFFSTKGSNRRGAGLGLASVYGIVQTLGGELAVQSALGKGSTFRIWLPCSDGSVPDADSATPAAEAPEGRTLLFVEDDEAVRTAMVRALRYHGHEVVVAVSGKEALYRVAQATEEFDAIVTDAVMPELSGPDFIAEVRRRGGVTPIILVSGYSEELADEEQLKKDAVRFLPKPYLVEDLVRLISEVTS